MRVGTTLLVTCLGMLALHENALAQDLVKPAGRQGYYIALGLRNGAMFADSDTVGGLGFMQGGGLAFRFGQMAGQHVGFGLAVASAGGASKKWQSGIGGLQLEGQFVVEENLALRAAIGVGALSVMRKEESERREDDPEGTAGSLYTVGMSYDWFPWWEKGDTSGGLAFTVFLEGILLPTDGLTAGGIQIGIEVGYWFGLAKNKLDLTVDEAYEED